MKGVFLDLKGLEDLPLSVLTGECESLQCHETTAPNDVDNRIAGAELIIVNKVKLTRDHLQQARSLRLICLVATGTDVIDLQAARDFGITVCNCRNYGTASVVQHVFSLILALQTNLLLYHKAIQGGRWQQATQFCFLDYPISELKDKTLGIIGYGTLGKAVAEVAKAFGMKLMVARRPGVPRPDQLPLEEMLPQVDILTLHCPLTTQTKNIINQQALQSMKPTALLINAARGGLVDEQALLESLIQGDIAGAAVDVLTTEPPLNSNPLLEGELPNLIVTPHIAWASREARVRILEQTAENIRTFKAGSPTRVVC